MRYTKEEIGSVLRELGMPEETIGRCLLFLEDAMPQEACRILKCFRCGMLEELHEKQHQLDRLDYLLHEIRKMKE